MRRIPFLIAAILLIAILPLHASRLLPTWQEDKDGMLEAFSEAYGYTFTSLVLSDGYSVDKAMWTKGLWDALEEKKDTPVMLKDMNGILDEAFLSASIPDSPSFSYAFAYAAAYHMGIVNDNEIVRESFVKGAEAAFGTTDDNGWTDKDAESAIRNYTDYLEELYSEYVLSLRVTNLLKMRYLLRLPPVALK